MVSPITYTTTVLKNSLNAKGSYYVSRTRSNQVKPYNRAAEYEIKRGYCLSGVSSGGKALSCNVAATISPWQMHWGPDVAVSFSDYTVAGQNSAIEKFRDKVSDTANLVVNWLERQQSLDMIEKRALQLLRFTNAVRRGNVRGAASLLGVRMLPPKAAAKRGGALWLEFHFGWEPLIKDIGNAVEILQSPLGDKPVKARGKPIAISVDWRRDFGTQNPDGSYRDHQSARIRGYAQTSITATVRVTNPSLYRANQLGFLNPALVAWELVPFSFVVDWFVPVGGFLSSFTENCGITFLDPCRFNVIATPDWSSRSWYDPTGATAVQTFTGFYGRRLLGIPSMTLGPRMAVGLSPTRAATAISLLLQGLRSV